ncbi:MAG: hypothetical protein ABIH72_03645 [archaeon]
MRGKRGDMQLPFGMIFSIFLIVLFVIIAFIAINHFLELRKCTQIASYMGDLKDSVDIVWKSPSSSQEFSGYMPKDIDYLCFVDFSKASTNKKDIFDELKRYDIYEASVYLYPPEQACNLPYYYIPDINISKITNRLNPYCIENIDSKISFRIEKGYYERLVCIGSDC